MFRSTNTHARTTRSFLSAFALIGAIGGGTLLATSAAAAAPEAATSTQPAIGWLSGRVLDFDGNPLAGVYIEIELPPAASAPKTGIAEKGTKSAKPGRAEETKRASQFVRTTTDWRGRFHVGNLPDSLSRNWVYPVRASHPKYGRAITAAVVVGGDDTSVLIEFRPFDEPAPTGRPIVEIPTTIGSVTPINGSASAAK